MTEKFPVGAVFKNRQVIEIKTFMNTSCAPINKGGGRTSFKQFRKKYLTRCLDCSNESWIRLDGKRGTNPSGCPCRGGRYPQSYPRTKKWTLEYWISVGRPYRPTANAKKGVKKARRDMVRQFLHTEQQGLCKLCNQPLAIEGSHIEHNHITDAVRGLVHPLCNYLIGVLEFNLNNGVPLPSIPQIINGFFSYL